MPDQKKIIKVLSNRGRIIFQILLKFWYDAGTDLGVTLSSFFPISNTTLEG